MVCSATISEATLATASAVFSPPRPAAGRCARRGGACANVASDVCQGRREARDRRAPMGANGRESPCGSPRHSGDQPPQRRGTRAVGSDVPRALLPGGGHGGAGHRSARDGPTRTRRGASSPRLPKRPHLRYAVLDRVCVARPGWGRPQSGRRSPPRSSLLLPRRHRGDRASGGRDGRRGEGRVDLQFRRATASRTRSNPEREVRNLRQARIGEGGEDTTRSASGP
jgi:hypothetical protein